MGRQPVKVVAVLTEGHAEGALDGLAGLSDHGDLVALTRPVASSDFAGVDEDVLLLDLTDISGYRQVEHVVKDAIRAFAESGPDILVALDDKGEELPFLRIVRPGMGAALESRCMTNRRVLPFRVSIPPFDRQRRLSEAEAYRDRIGDRLFDPEKVAPENRVLVGDDVQRVKTVLALPVGEKLLDVGCSDGSVTLEIVKKWRCHEATGVDIAASAVAEARQRAERANLQDRVRFLEGFIEDIGFPKAYFDTVYAGEVLEHVDASHLELALGHMVGLLRPGGNMIISVPNRYPASRYSREGRSRWRWPAHYNFFTRHSLGLLLRRYFSGVEFMPLYPGEAVEDGIYLIADCRKG